MHVAYLIGNGFDIALGLKTRYIDFYNYYISTDSNSSLIEQFKSDLAREMLKTDKWSDFELDLGIYVEKLSDESLFDELIVDIRSELSAYLTSIQNNFSSDSNPKGFRNIFLEHLFRPEDYLSGRSKEALELFYNSFKSTAINFNIVNFNYTNTIEQLLGITQVSNEHKNLSFKVSLNNVDRKLNNIYHVHGSVVADMVLGVNDENQIKNLKFRKNQDVRNDFIKSECNLAQEHGVEVKCTNILNHADVICIFGSSLGKTDNFWWESVAEHVRTTECRLVVFEYKINFSKLNSSHKPRFKREIINKIFGDNQPIDLERKVYVSINSDLFKWKLD